MTTKAYQYAFNKLSILQSFLALPNHEAPIMCFSEFKITSKLLSYLAYRLEIIGLYEYLWLHP